MKCIIGIDEVGRGPIAGPVTVCALAIKKERLIKRRGKYTMVHFENFKDSKKLSPQQRSKWLEKINQEKVKGNLFYKVNFASNKIIDQKGIVFAINSCLKKSLRSLKIKPAECWVLLDGGLRAPKEFVNQKTIIKGDEKELAIALASIVAKVTRDRYMEKLAKKYSQYGLERHKGYGTISHYTAIQSHGLSPIHRRSFLREFRS